jgi:CDP-glycerol glycerophosphotransferase
LILGKFPLFFKERLRLKVLVIDRRPYSGSSALVLHKELVKRSGINCSYYSYANRGLIERVKFLYHLITSKVIVVTHSPFKLKRGQICIQLWHGMPIKGVGLKDAGEVKDRSEIIQRAGKADYYVSSSNLYSSVMTSSFGINKSKFVYTSFPRLDILRGSSVRGKNFLNSIFHSSDNIFAYMPTYRSLDAVRAGKQKSSEWLENIIDELKVLNTWLLKNESYIVIKLHPYDEALISAEIFDGIPNVSLVTLNDLQNNQIDFYSILSCCSCLITDFSSVIFDYLVLDRPIIRFSNDNKTYIENRSLNFKNSDLGWCHSASSAMEVVDCLEEIKLNNYAVSEAQISFKEKYESPGIASGSSSSRLADFIQGLPIP